MDKRDIYIINKTFYIIENSTNYISVRDATRMVVNSTADSFFCSRETISLILRNKYKKCRGNKLLISRNNKIREIAKGLKGLSHKEVVEYIYKSKAPRLYLSENSAMLLFYKKIRNRKCLNI